jgi:hypothetical protein
MEGGREAHHSASKACARINLPAGHNPPAAITFVAMLPPSLPVDLFSVAMTWVEWAEVLSYIVTIVGLPMAIVVFLYEQRKERRNEQEEIYQRLSDEYTTFLRLVLDNADLHLLRKGNPGEDLTEEQKERKFAIFNILVSLFERAYLLVYDDEMDRQTRRLWLSWEDYMREWCRRADFRAALGELLRGEDEDFAFRLDCIDRSTRTARGKPCGIPHAPPIYCLPSKLCPPTQPAHRRSPRPLNRLPLGGGIL